jgi:hypothetical protein
MNMSLQRFTALVDAYGGDLGRWPESERKSACLLIEHNVHAQSLLAEASGLDNELDKFVLPAFSGLETKLNNQALPSHPPLFMERLASWMIPQPGHVLTQLWRPAAAACLPLVLGLYIGGQIEIGAGLKATDVYFVSSEEEELYLISLSDYAEVM